MADEFAVIYASAAAQGFASASLPKKWRNRILRQEFREHLNSEIRAAVELFIIENPAVFRDYLETRILLATQNGKELSDLTIFEAFAVIQTKDWALTHYLASNLLSRSLNILLLKVYPERVLLENEAGKTRDIKVVSAAPRENENTKPIEADLDAGVSESHLTFKDREALRQKVAELEDGRAFLSFMTTAEIFHNGKFVRTQRDGKEIVILEGEREISIAVESIDWGSLVFRGVNNIPSRPDGAVAKHNIWSDVDPALLNENTVGQPARFEIQFGPKTQELWLTLNRGGQVDRFNGKEEHILKRLVRVLRLLQANPRERTLKTHKLRGAHFKTKYRGIVFESYLEEKNSTAARIFWTFGDRNNVILIIGVEPHPENDKAYERMELDWASDW